MGWIDREETLEALRRFTLRRCAEQTAAGHWLAEGLTRAVMADVLKVVRGLPDKHEAKWLVTKRSEACYQVVCSNCGDGYAVSTNISLRDWVNDNGHRSGHRYCQNCGAHMTGGIDMTLNDTAKGMVSEDYKERFKAEYEQLVIRYYKLRRMIRKWDDGDLDFTPTCNRGIYNLQVRAMADYIACLESRAQIEGIELPEVEV